MKIEKQIVYIPTKVEDELPEEDGRYGIKVNKDNCIDSSYIELGEWDIEKQAKLLKVKVWLKPTEIYAFTPEELKQMLEDYTNRIIENVKTVLIEDECPLTGQEFEIREVDKKSIQNQLTIILKELEL
jgi:hypothetical protein